MNQEQPWLLPQELLFVEAQKPGPQAWQFPISSQTDP
jgi:hypothetical protein